MGVVNITPDSFSDGGRFLEPHAAIHHARKLAEDGADLIDLGGESTRPGAAAVSEAEELHRVLPVLHLDRADPFPRLLPAVGGSSHAPTLCLGAAVHRRRGHPS